MQFQEKPSVFEDPRMSMKFGNDFSAIKPDESAAFLTPAEKSELFANNGMQPDVIGIPRPPATPSSKDLIENRDDYG